MNELFLKIINMSISASWLVLAVLILRFVLNVVSQNKVPVSCTKTANYYISSIMMSLCTCL